VTFDVDKTLMLSFFLMVTAVHGFSPSLLVPIQSLESRSKYSRAAWSLGSTRTDDILAKHASTITELKTHAAQDFDDVQLLRFAVAFEDDVDAAVAALKEADAWRKGEGKGIAEAAAAAVEAATAGGSWDNEEIFSRAPHGTKISPYISPTGSQFVTLISRDGQSGVPYLVKVVRAAGIDDKALMAAVSKEQLVDFFSLRDRGELLGGR